MKTKFFYLRIFVGFLLFLFSKSVYAQTEQEKVIATILHLDSLFWNAYNNCDSAKFKDFFTDDVEFYHDKGGATFGIQALVSSLDKNLCGNNDYHLRREAIDNS